MSSVYESILYKKPYYFLQGFKKGGDLNLQARRTSKKKIIFSGSLVKKLWNLPQIAIPLARQ